MLNRAAKGLAHFSSQQRGQGCRRDLGGTYVIVFVEEIPKTNEAVLAVDTRKVDPYTATEQLIAAFRAR